MPGAATIRPLKFLVIRRDNIGDLVCTTPIFRALRQHFPDAHICAFVNSYNLPVLANNPDLDQVFAYTKAKHRSRGAGILGFYFARVKQLIRLRRIGFDYVILANPGFHPRLARLARLIGPKHILGFINDKSGARNLDMGVPRTLPQPMHESDDIFRLLAPLGIAGEPPRARVFPSSEDAGRMRAAAEHGLRGIPYNLVGVHISARKPSQRWPAENFVAFIRELTQRHRVACLLFWSPGGAADPRHPGDDAKARTIAAGLGDAPVVPLPTLNLGDLIAGISLCDWVVCSDGGAMHIAAALGKPMVCFFGKSDSVRWRPRGVCHVLLQPASLDVNGISPNDALDAFAALLQKCAGVGPAGG